jgi:hypothetical protein
MTSFACPRCGFDNEAFEAYTVHAFAHLFEEITTMSNSIDQLTTADQDEAAAEQGVSAAVGNLAAEQAQFLTDIKAALAGLGNNDQVSAIAADIEGRVTALNAIAAQVQQEQADQVAADPATPVTPPADGTGDGAADPTAGDGVTQPVSATETTDSAAAVAQ